ncbi:MAG TPA: uridine diphosphate-N-acetylglucosamine-binding protein YvcK [Vicinamibacterales bacterium]|nr:uridine diphosphate-N-acetylglucosamine-binding protein YvcK [Vicinamibacterales bacterium]
MPSRLSPFSRSAVEDRDATPRLTHIPRVVAIGGGTGLPNVLRGLRPILYGERDSTPRDQLVAIVTTSDDGGSSGRLRTEFGMTPPGDIRNCLAALSEHQGMIADLFQYRFGGGNGLNGHALGNLVLAALADVTNDFPRAVELAGRVLGASGTVLPATTEAVTLVAELADGRTVRGETLIREAHGAVRRLTLSPPAPLTPPAAIEAIRNADVVVVGPGSLYTSLLPPLLVRELAAALAASRAARIFVMNLMTEPGETDGYDAPAHLRVVTGHVGARLFDFVLYSTSAVPEALVKSYGSRGASPVRVTGADIDELSAMGVRAIGVPLASKLPPCKIRHHPERLAAAITAVARGKLGAWRPRVPVQTVGGED